MDRHQSVKSITKIVYSVQYVSITPLNYFSKEIRRHEATVFRDICNDLKLCPSTTGQVCNTMLTWKAESLLAKHLQKQ